MIYLLYYSRMQKLLLLLPLLKRPTMETFCSVLMECTVNIVVVLVTLSYWKANFLNLFLWFKKVKNHSIVILICQRFLDICSMALLNFIGRFTRQTAMKSWHKSGLTKKPTSILLKSQCNVLQVQVSVMIVLVVFMKTLILNWC